MTTDTTTPSVAVLGTGTMGAPMARNIAAAGMPTAAWNRTPEKAAPLRDDGVEVHDDTAGVVAGRDIVITMLADADAVLSVAAEMLPAMEDGAVWAQMSTIGIDGTERCAAIAADRGVAFVDAPVLGTRQPAEQGTLLVLASGPHDALARCEPVFDAVGQRTMRVGDAGAGTRLKLAVNAWLLSAMEGIAETLALAEGLGLDPSLPLEAIKGGPLDMPYAHLKGALIARREFPPSFALKLAAKDARLVTEAAARHGLDLPLERTVAERMGQAVEAGYGDEDMAAVWRLCGIANG
jgi:3-hydroxyisobutyrate dehydrogenase